MKDLFEHYEELPQNVQDLILEMGDTFTYKENERFIKKFNALGYTFDYGLDSCPIDLAIHLSKKALKQGVAFHFSNEVHQEAIGDDDVREGFVEYDDRFGWYGIFFNGKFIDVYKTYAATKKRLNKLFDVWHCEFTEANYNHYK